MGYSDRQDKSKGRSKRPSFSNIPRAISPYNFVPFNTEVVIPDWEDQVTHDFPFRDGISGNIKLRIRAHSPLITADKKEERAVESNGKKRKVECRTHFKLPNGKYGLLGSALRGMLRSVVEIASYGKLTQINDRYFGIRDLNNRSLYGDHMAKIVGGEPTPLVCAGWLRPNLGPDRDENPAILTPCEYAKIHYNHLIMLAKKRLGVDYNPGQKQDSPKKYRLWRNKKSRLDWDRTMNLSSFRCEGSSVDLRNHNGIGRYHKKVQEIDSGNCRDGKLVFTGQPANWFPEKNQQKRKRAGNAKQHDFVFFNRRDESGEIKIPKRTFDGFRSAHSSGGEQHRLTDSNNAELSFWLSESDWMSVLRGKQQFREYHNEIPVFFLLKKGTNKVRSMGLAQMFRLAYDHSTKELAQQVWKQDGSVVNQKETPKRDMAELIFGNILENKKENKSNALKGRVQIGHAHLKGAAVRLQPVSAVLGPPRASFYPNYVEQNPNPKKPGQPAARKGSTPIYKTYMDVDTQIRGHKRYLQRPYPIDPVLPKIQGRVIENDKVLTHFEPIQLGESAYFETTISVHNLKPVELGALLWALDFGGAEGTRHQIGLAKSLGYGSVSIQVDSDDLFHVASFLEDSLESVDRASCVQAFITYMNTQIKDWSASRRIFELIELARPVSEKRSKEEIFPEISHPKYGNMFASIKKQGFALSTRGSELDYGRWAQQNRSQQTERERQKEEAEQAQELARKEAELQAELERLSALSPLERVKDIVSQNGKRFLALKWYDWLLADEIILKSLPKFSEVSDKESLISWLTQEFDLEKARKNIPSYEGDKPRQLQALLRKYQSGGQGNSASGGFGTKEIQSNLLKKVASEKGKKNKAKKAPQLAKEVRKVGIYTKESIEQAISLLEDTGRYSTEAIASLKELYSL